MIRIENLDKSYNDLKILNNISLEIEKGMVFGIIGQSGEGKSTLLKCINGITEYDNGNIVVDGVNVSKLSKKNMRNFRREIGMIFQDFALLNMKTVIQNVKLPLEFGKYEKKYIDNRAIELLDMVGLKDKAQSIPRELSGGQKQRVAIARALALNPKIILCDEATSALDPKTTQSILSLLKEINIKLGITVVIVTHEMEVIKSICDKVAILSNGEINVTGTIEDVFMGESESLMMLIGDREISVKKGNIPLKIIVKSDVYYNNIIYKMSVDLKCPFSVIVANVDKYGDKSFGYYIVEVEESKEEILVNYLNKRGIESRKCKKFTCYKEESYGF